MSTKKILEELFEESQFTIKNSYERLLADIEFYSSNPEDATIVAFYEKFIQWRKDENHKYYLWMMFQRVIDVNSPVWFMSFRSFVANYIIDDSYFEICWTKPNVGDDYNGDPLTTVVATSKEDPKARPIVYFSNDERGFQDPALLLEAMNLLEKREEEEAVRIRREVASFLNHSVGDP